MFSDTVCDLCKKEDDTTQHYLECLVLISKCPELFKNDMKTYLETWKHRKEKWSFFKRFSTRGVNGELLLWHQYYSGPMHYGKMKGIGKVQVCRSNETALQVLGNIASMQSSIFTALQSLEL